jgi:hypothetical protein
MGLLAVALICAMSTPYDQCRRDTALDVIAMPVAMPLQCALQGQALVAGSALVERLNGSAYLKVSCERRRV